MKDFEYWAMMYWANYNLEEFNKEYGYDFKLPKSKNELYDLAYNKWYWLEEKLDYEKYIPFKDYLNFLENEG